MRVPLTKYGLPQVAVYPLAILVLMAVLFLVFWPAIWLIPLEAFLFLVFVWMLSFFRDPSRTIVADETILYSPADGTVTDISLVDDNELGAEVLRIGIFLSVFNVHINRVPCYVRIESVTYKKGRFINAASSEASKVNESNDILMQRLSEPKDRLLVRQITGAIARHIVCRAQAGEEYRQGQPFGMIKFGSRTELYLPAGDNFEICAKIGDKLRAGLSPLIRYNKP
ncbi:MAG: phosphatidylserine decarboxylase [Treponema sp.]|nr:phosphatidylserine decarboxylase [Treponema sp.]